MKSGISRNIGVIGLRAMGIALSAGSAVDPAAEPEAQTC